MINHFLTLLLNLSGSQNQSFSDYPGEEIIDPTFIPLTLPSYLTTLRSQIFGTNPDRCMLNYRARQLLDVIHATPLKEHLLALDGRITYVLNNYDWPDSIFVPQVFQLAGTSGDKLIVIGNPLAPDIYGRSYFQYSLVLQSPSTTEVTLFGIPIQKTLFDFNIVNNLSTPISLFGSGYNARLSTNDLTQQWQIIITNRPQYDLSQIVTNISQLHKDIFDSLFGIIDIEPYTTFRNLWSNNNELPLKLGGLVCAVVYRSEEIRIGVR